MRKRREFTEAEVAYAVNEVYNKEYYSGVPTDCDDDMPITDDKTIVGEVEDRITQDDYYFLELKKTALDYAFRINNSAGAKQLIKDANKIEEFLIN